MPNLLSIERVCLFGVLFQGFSEGGKVPGTSAQLDQGGSIHPSSGIQETLKEDADPRLARIYAMSYEGGYSVLPRPTVFLVHGPGKDPEKIENMPGG
ncbi:MAG: hypothetical protein OEU92_11400, partial [Alphaproteobacteria bacterium]|nr:hypothetical protein [Alphaproteobacteria bacterium]